MLRLRVKLNAPTPSGNWKRSRMPPIGLFGSPSSVKCRSLKFTPAGVWLIRSFISTVATVALCE